MQENNTEMRTNYCTTYITLQNPEEKQRLDSRFFGSNDFQSELPFSRVRSIRRGCRQRGSFLLQLTNLTKYRGCKLICNGRYLNFSL